MSGIVPTRHEDRFIHEPIRSREIAKPPAETVVRWPRCDVAEWFQRRILLPARNHLFVTIGAHSY